MSIPAINSGTSVAAVARKDQSRGASATASDKPPVFSRGADARSMAGLGEAEQVDSKKPRHSFQERAVIGDLLRIVGDLKAEDVPAAKQRLAMMSTIDLDHFFMSRKIDPSLLGQLKTAIHGRAEAHSSLKEVFRVLERSGASRLSSQLRPAASS